MARHRLGVALLVPGPVGVEVDGLRRALGDGALGRIPPHLTLVPPVNVREAELGDAVAVLRAAAADSGPLRLRVGPAATFHPVTPVVYLEVGGDLAALQALRARVFRPPLERPLTYPFTPHVTIAEELPPERIPAAVAALTDFRVELTVDRLHLLREEPGRTWQPLADVALGPAAVVARGGLPVELEVSERAGPDLDRLRAAPGTARPFAVTARRQGLVVGMASGWSQGPRTALAELVVVDGARRQGVGRHLLTAVEDLARRRGSSLLDTVAPDEPAAAALLAHAGWQAGATAGRGWRRWERRLGEGTV